MLPTGTLALSRGDQKIFSAIGGTGTHLVIESPSSHTIPVTQSQDIPVHDTGTCTRTEGLAGGCPEEGREVASGRKVTRKNWRSWG